MHGSSSRQAQGWLLLIAGLFLWLILQIAPKHFASKQELTPPRYQVDINSAEIVEFLNLPEVGPSLAKSIVDFRSQHGPFHHLSDLAEVRGIGPRTLQRLSPYLIFPAPPTIDSQDTDSCLTASGQTLSSSH